MTEVKVKILIVEHDKADIAILLHLLKNGGINFITEIVENELDFENTLRTFEPEIILSDYNLPGFNGLAACMIKEKISPDTPFILVSGFIGEENALELIKSGVTDYVLKDKLAGLPFKITRAISEARARLEKQKAEQELKLSEKRLARAQQLGQMGSWELDMSTNKVIWSAEMYKIYNCDPELFIPTEASVINLYPHDLRESLRISFLKMKSGIEQPGKEFSINAADGSVKYVQSHNEIIFDERGKPVKVIGIVQDVTERKLMEDDLKQAKVKADRGKVMQEQFLANMSHEIRTPMNAIVGFSTLLKKAKLSEKENQYITRINIASENLLGIINNILDLSKIDSDMISIDKSVVQLPSLLESVQSMMQGNALQKKLEISLYINPSLPEYIFCDQTRLSQILINLTNNAIKFTENGFVNIMAEVCENNPRGKYIKFIIQDSGIGIAKENQELIFERFQQEHSDTTRKYGGTGLGLSIVKNIVKLMGGEISVKSEPGKGSQFTVLIPLQKCTFEQVAEYKLALEKSAATNNLKLGRLKILLAEDNRMNQQYVSAVMEEFGFTCTVAVNGEDAVNKMKENSYDLILMDIQMPEMDGYEATRIIRHELKSNIPIIALTANAAHRYYQKCLQAGMNGFISKPYKPQDLYDKITELQSQKLISISNPDIPEVMESSEIMKNKFDPGILMKQMNGKTQAVNELLTIFMEDTPRDIEALEEAIRKEEYHLIKNISHNLVSSFSVINLEPGIRVLKAIEHNAENKKEITTIKALFFDLIKITDKTKSEIREIIFAKLQHAG